MVKNLPANSEDEFDPWVGKIPWRRIWQPTPVFLPGKSRGQRNVAGYTVHGSQTCLIDSTTLQLEAQLQMPAFIFLSRMHQKLIT